MANLNDEFVKSGGEFKVVKLKELFVVKANPQLNKESFVFAEDAKYPYFTRTVLNNGIAGYVKYLDEEHRITGNCLAVGMLGMQFFYMEKDFYAGQFTKSVYPIKDKITRFNANIAQYFIAVLNRYQPIFQGMLVRDFEKTFYDSEVELPFSNNLIDVEYIENYVRELQKERLRELQKERLRLYLKATGLSSYDLTDDELNATEGGAGREWRSFRIGDLFTINTGSLLNANELTAGTVKRISVKSDENGIIGEFDTLANKKARHFENFITVNFFGGVFYHPYKASVEMKVHTLKINGKDFDTKVGLYLVSALSKALQGRFGYGNQLSSSLLKKGGYFIQLPVDQHNKPDYSFMETFISAVQKLVIKDVVLYADKKIATVEQVIEKTK